MAWQMSRISAATVNITIWMMGVTPIGSVVPSAAAIVGRMSGNKPNIDDRQHAEQEDVGGVPSRLRVASARRGRPCLDAWRACRRRAGPGTQDRLRGPCPCAS